MAKTAPEIQYGPLDHFLYGKVTNATHLRVPSMVAKYEGLVAGVMERMRAVVEAGPAILSAPHDPGIAS